MSSSEYDYLNLCRAILEKGERRQTRNGLTRSIFGTQLRFDLRDGFPLLTTKKMFYRGIVEELLWFMRGQTDNRILKEKGVHIWDGNSTRSYLDGRGLCDYAEDECGPIYGYQWRRFNCAYQGRDVPIDNVPVSRPDIDQLQEVVRLLKTDPTSRRIILSGWNPCQLKEMCLEPCHVLYQFYVDADRGLRCSMYQRSADFFLGVPFNIASCAILTHILADICGLIPREVIISFGDAHIYEDHVGVVETQLQRQPMVYPRLIIHKTGKDATNIDEYLATLTADDFQIVGYNSYPALKAKML